MQNGCRLPRFSRVSNDGRQDAHDLVCFRNQLLKPQPWYFLNLNLWYHLAIRHEPQSIERLTRCLPCGALVGILHSPFCIVRPYRTAFAPPTMSASSSVICDCRARLYCRVRNLIMSPAASVALFIATMRATCSLTMASLKI